MICSYVVFSKAHTQQMIWILSCCFKWVLKVLRERQKYEVLIWATEIVKQMYGSIIVEDSLGLGYFDIEMTYQKNI